MPLAVAPAVRIGTDPTWYATAFDTSRTAAAVSRGRQSMTVRDVQFWYWTVALDEDAPQVYRLLVAGTAVASPPAGAAIVPAGQHVTFSRVTDTPEVIEHATGVFRVTD